MASANPSSTGFPVGCALVAAVNDATCASSCSIDDTMSERSPATRDRRISIFPVPSVYQALTVGGAVGGRNPHDVPAGMRMPSSFITSTLSANATAGGGGGGSGIGMSLPRDLDGWVLLHLEVLWPLGRISTSAVLERHVTDHGSRPRAKLLHEHRDLGPPALADDRARP